MSKSIPSEAVINLNRYSGNLPLYGVEHQVNRGFELTISEAITYDSFGTEKVMEGRQYVSINMSYTQFVELITSIGSGNVIPVTMSQFETYKILPLKETKNAIEIVTDYCELSQIEELEEIKKMALLHAEKPNKETKKNLLNVISNFDKNRNFYEKRIKEVTKLSKVRALSEIENSMIAKFAEIGKEAVRTKLIEEDVQLQLPFDNLVQGENK